MFVKINKISDKVSINKDTFRNDFEIIKLMKSKVDYALNIYDTFGSDKEYIKAIFYERKNYSCAYILVEKDKVSLDVIKKNFLKYKDISLTKEKDIPLSAYLNLLLLNQSDKISEKEKYIINNNFYHIVSLKRKTIVTLQLRFVEKDDGIYLENKVVTFSKYSELSEKDKNKQKVFYTLGGETLKRIYDIKGIREEDIYVQKNIYNKTKNAVNSLLFDTNVYDSKLGIMGKIYKIFSKECKYINNFSFAEVEMNLYKNKKLFDSYKKGKNIVANYINDKELIIVSEDDVDDIINENIKKEYKYKISNEIGSGLNLVVLNENTRGQNEEDDIRYLNDKKRNNVIQHIGRENLKQEISVKKCLQELIIKNDIKNKYISYFDWDVYKEENINKSYTFFLKTVTKDENMLYHSITVNTSGEILDIKINEEESFDREVFNAMTEKDLGAIKDSDNNIIILKNVDDCFILPDFDNFLNEMDKYIEGKKYPFTGNEWYEVLSQIEEERHDLKDSIDDFILANNGIYEGSDEVMSFESFEKKKIKINKGLKSEMDKFLKDKYHLAIVGAFKGEKFLDENFAGVLGISYNENNFVIGSTSHYMGQTLTNNIKLREIEVVEGENFFEELLDMFYVPFVKNEFLTILPFPFKYLREAIDNPNLK